jgi:sugar O-acyltransferase (sialic acid O-acetyltransferase NeuD family)
MSRRLIILGAGGLAREMAQLAHQVNLIEKKWEFAGYIAESAADTGKMLSFGPILGDDEWLLSQSFEADLLIGIGYPKVKEKVLSRYLNQPDRFGFPNFIHPGAKVDLAYVNLGNGNAIAAGCIFTCDIQVGSFNLFNLSVTVGHDCRFGDYNVFNPTVNVSGGVKIGDCVLAGTGSQILENRMVGSHATIGAGAVVTKDVPDRQTVVGIPAKPLPQS